MLEILLVEDNQRLREALNGWLFPLSRATLGRRGR
jgi:hypothetical protein